MSEYCIIESRSFTHPKSLFKYLDNNEFSQNCHRNYNLNFYEYGNHKYEELIYNEIYFHLEWSNLYRNSIRI